MVGDGRGLYLEVFPSGAKCWRFRYALHGRSHKMALGRWPKTSLTTARRKRDRLKQMIEEGLSPADELRRRQDADCTVREFGPRWVRDVVAQRRKSTARTMRVLERTVYPAIGKRTMASVEIGELQDLVFAKRDAGHPAAAAELRHLLKRMWDYAVVCRAATSNPAKEIPTWSIGRSKPRTRALSERELKLVMAQLHTGKMTLTARLSLEVILRTLVRKSEFVLAQWSEFNWDKHQWEIPAEHSKGGLAHIVHLTPQTEQLLRKLQALAGNHPCVLPGRSTRSHPVSAAWLNKRLHDVNWPVPEFTIHDFRRTASTLLHEQGFSADVIEKALNHTIKGIRGVYNRAEHAEERRSMLIAWSNWLDGLRV